MQLIVPLQCRRPFYLRSALGVLFNSLFQLIGFSRSYYYWHYNVVCMSVCLSVTQ